MTKEEKIAELQSRGFAWPIPWESVRLIASSEDRQLRAYRCSAGVPTVGWGETQGVSMGDVWTAEQADTRFFQEVGKYTDAVKAMLTVHTSPLKLGALVSLAYNIGLGGLRKSTVLRTHNEGNEAAAARAFGLWNKARVNGQLVELRGLTSRRAAEAAMYLTPEAHPYPEPTPQAVAEESSIAKSPINVAGAAGVSAGGLTVVSEMFDGVKPVMERAADFAMTFSINPGIMLGIIILVAGGTSMYWRHKQRKEGWA